MILTTVVPRRFYTCIVSEPPKQISYCSTVFKKKKKININTYTVLFFKTLL